MSKQHKYNYIYKTTCSMTGKYYIGMHSTSNLEDGYIGSGRRLWLTINKHGKENHSIQILEWLPDRSSLKLRERELVNEELLNDSMCMNLQLGGGGGFTGDEHAQKFHKAGRLATNKVLHDRLQNDVDYRKRFCESVSNSLKGNQFWLNKKHTEETKLKIGEANSIKQKGPANSQHGTCWITNGFENKKIKKTDDLPQGWSYGRKIRIHAS